MLDNGLLGLAQLFRQFCDVLLWIRFFELDENLLKEVGLLWSLFLFFVGESHYLYFGLF
jgi:hypothetical protein